MAAPLHLWETNPARAGSVRLLHVNHAAFLGWHRAAWHPSLAGAVALSIFPQIFSSERGAAH